MSVTGTTLSMPTLALLCQRLSEVASFTARVRTQGDDIDRYLEHGSVPPQDVSKDQSALSNPPLLQIQDLTQLINGTLAGLEGSLERIASHLGVVGSDKKGQPMGCSAREDKVPAERSG